jgi:hypothetical protein
MKKPFLFLALLLASLGALAQSKLQLGLTAGPNISNLRWFSDPNGITVQDSKWAMGWQIGLSADYQFSEWLGLSFQPVWVRKGARYTTFGLGAPSPSSERLNLDYLDLPLLLRGRPWRSLFIETGPVLGLRVGISNTETGPLPDVVKRIYRKTDFGLAAGAGWQASPRLSFGFRFVQGLIDVLDVNYTDLNGEILPRSEQPRWLNQSIQFSVGYVLLGGS